MHISLEHAAEGPPFECCVFCCAEIHPEVRPSWSISVLVCVSSPQRQTFVEHQCYTPESGSARTCVRGYPSGSGEVCGLWQLTRILRFVCCSTRYSYYNNTILTPKAGSPGHLWSYQTQHMCRRLANTHHTSCRTQTIPHTSERGGGISCTRRTPARSISLTTHDSPLSSAREVRPPRRLQARQRHTQTTPHTFERVAVASAARDRRLRAASALRRATLF